MINTLLSFNDRVDYMEVVIYTRDTNSDFKSEVRLKVYEWQLTGIKAVIDNFLKRGQNEGKRTD